VRQTGDKTHQVIYLSKIGTPYQMVLSIQISLVSTIFLLLGLYVFIILFCISIYIFFNRSHYCNILILNEVLHENHFWSCGYLLKYNCYYIIIIIIFGINTNNNAFYLHFIFCNNKV
jgi:hypothetical protein